MILLALAILPAIALAEAPSWWSENGVITSGATVNDYAALNQGQLKNLATKAYGHLQSNLPSSVWTTSTGSNLVSLITVTFSGNNPNRNDYAAVNLGQLKAVAKPFYDVLKLSEVGYTTEYPWASAPASTVNDYAAANIGQAKYLFSFDFSMTGAGYWNLDETSGTIARDSTSAHNAANIQGSVTWSPTSGRVNGALAFNGSTYATLSNSSILDMPSHDLTLALWVKLDCTASQYTTSQYMRLISKKAQWNSAGGYELEYNPSLQRICFGGQGAEQLLAYQIDLNSGWHHIALTLQKKAGSNNYDPRLYIDGVEKVKSTTAPATATSGVYINDHTSGTIYHKADQSMLPLQTSPASLTFGFNGQIGSQSPTITTEAFIGLLDEIHVYKRALAATEIQNLYQQETPTNPPQIPDWWKIQHFGSASDPRAGWNADPDSDGVNNLTEYAQGGNPLDYYDRGTVSITPVLTIQSGGVQSGLGNSFSTQPLLVKVTDSEGNGLNRAPVTFLVAGNDGALSFTNVGSPQTFATVTLYADSDGVVRYNTSGQECSLYCRYAPTAGYIREVEILAGNAIPEMAEYSTSGGSGAPVIPVLSTLSAVVGQSFAYTIQASGSPVSYGVEGLPLGLSVNTLTGNISGVPSLSGVYSLAVTATNTNGSTQAQLMLTVLPGGPLITSTTSAATAVGQPFVYLIESDARPSHVTVSNLPGSLVYDQGNERISGEFASPGLYSFVITATNSDLLNVVRTSSQTVTVAVGNSLPVIQSRQKLTGLVKGIPYSHQIIATETDSATRYTASEIPEGLQINTLTGLISGIPTGDGYSSIAIVVSNSYGETSANSSIEVNTASTAIKRAYFYKDQWVSYQIPVGDDNNVVGYHISGLPSGLTCNSTTGLITGTPSTACAPEATITLTSSGNLGTSYKQIFVVMSTTSSVSATIGLQSEVSPLSGYLTQSASLVYDFSNSDSIYYAGNKEAHVIGAFMNPESSSESRAENGRVLLGFGLDLLPVDAQVVTANLQISGTVKANTTSNLLPTIRASALHQSVDWDSVTWYSTQSLSAVVLGDVTPTATGAATLTFATNAIFSNEVSTAHSYQREMTIFLNSINTEGLSATDRPSSMDLNNETSTETASRPLLQVGYLTGAPPDILSPEEWTIATSNSSALSFHILNSPTTFTASLLPAGITVSGPVNGVVTLSGVLTEEGDHDVTFSATNANGTATRSCQIRALSVPTLTGSTTLTVSAGQTISFTPTCSSGTVTYSGLNLPEGLSINSQSGLVTGIITNPKSYNLSLWGRNAVGDGWLDLYVTVLPVVVPTITLTTSSVSGCAGISFGYYIAASQDPTTYSATGLPSWLSVYSTSGYMSGTPTTSGSWTVTLRATNVIGTGSANLLITASDPPAPEIVPTILRGSAGTTFSGSLNINNLNGGSSHSVTISGLPSGLTYSGLEYGSISGVPINTSSQPQTFTVTITASSTYNTITPSITTTGTGTSSVIIYPQGPWLDQAVYAANQGSTASLYIYGYNGAVTATISSGLPAGLIFTQNTGNGIRLGTITGATTASGTFTISTIVTDRNGATNSVPITLTINPLSTLAGTPSVVTTVNSAFSYTLNASNSPTAYALPSGTLPAGCTLSGNIISGTPTVPGLYLMPVSITNAAGTATSILEVLVNPLPTDSCTILQNGPASTVTYQGMIANICYDPSDPESLSDSLQDVTEYSVGKLASNELRRILIQFDLSSLPDDIEITSATLGLYALAADPTLTTAATVYVYNTTQPFSSTFPNWENDSGYISVPLSQRTLSPGYAPGWLRYYSTPAFISTVTSSIGRGESLEMAIVAPGLESETSTGAVRFTATSTASSYNPTLAVTYRLLTPSDPPVIKPPLLINGTASQPLSYTIKASHRPTQYDATGLPSWLTLNTLSGVISGTPPVNATGEYHAVLTATNGVGASQGADLTILVQSSTPVTQLQVVSGNGQTGLVGAVLPSPIVVRALNGSTTVSGALVMLSAPDGKGGYVSGTSTASTKSVVTGVDGTVSISFQLPAIPTLITGTASTPGGVSTTFSAVSSDIAAASSGAEAVSLRLVSGGGQSAIAGASLASPVVVQALDAWGHPLAGRTLTAESVMGSGTISPLTATTNTDGQVAYTITLSGAAGSKNQFAATESTSGALIQIAANLSATASVVEAGGSRNTALDSTPASIGVGGISVSATVIDPFDNTEFVDYSESDPVQPTITITGSSGSLEYILVQRKYDNTDWEDVGRIYPGKSTLKETTNLLANRHYQYRAFAVANGQKSAPVTADYIFGPLLSATYNRTHEHSRTNSADSRDSWRDIDHDSFTEYGYKGLYDLYYDSYFRGDYSTRSYTNLYIENRTTCSYQYFFYPSAKSRILCAIYRKPSDPTPNDRLVITKINAQLLPASSSIIYSINAGDMPQSGTVVWDIILNDAVIYNSDEYESKNGISTTKNSGPEINLDPKFSSQIISWSGNFKVYAEDSDGNRIYISNGQTIDENWYKSSHGPLHIIGDENAYQGESTTLTLVRRSDGGSSYTSNAKIVYQDTRDFSVPIDEASGSRYRKIGLNGVPLPDGKPQQAEESDQEPEETYVDAMTLGLRHSTTDVFMQVPGSDLTLSARRDLSSEVWGLRNGLRPQEDPAKPFGVCWSSNLTPSIKFVMSKDNPKPSEPEKAYVIDEGGATHAFYVTYGKYDADASVRTGVAFVPMPTSKNQQSPSLESLTVDTSTKPATYVFKRKFGTTIRYEATAIDLVTPDDRLIGASTKQEVRYARAKTVTDRLGYQLDYIYASNKNLVPKTIAVHGHPEMKISIAQNTAGLITAIWDAKGNKTSYSYSALEYCSLVGQIQRLASVTTSDGGTTTYTYDMNANSSGADGVSAEADMTPQDPDMKSDDPGNIKTGYWHCDLKSITDPLNRTYTFTYALDHSKMNFKRDVDGKYPGAVGYYTQTGLPRNITKITLPDGKAQSVFTNNSKVWIEATTGTQSTLVAAGKRQNLIADASGFTRTYTWDNSEVLSVPQIRKSYPDTNSFTEPKLIAYKTMTVKHGSYGTETFDFDLNASMALSHVKDFSGNDTYFNYADTYSSAFGQALGTNSTAFSHYGDPTSQVKVLTTSNGLMTLTKSFTYTTSARIMNSTTDELGRYTLYGVDALGRRISERVMTTVSGTVVKSTTFEYGNVAYPGFMTKRVVDALSGDQSGATSLVTQYVPDSNGRIAQEIVDPDHLHLVTSYTYDKNGNKASVTDPRGNTSWFGYNSRNRLVTVTFADGAQKQIVYDVRGNKSIEYDENGHATFYQYDTFNRLVAQGRRMESTPIALGSGGIVTATLASDLVSSSTYNALNYKTSVTDPRGNRTKMTYDDLGRLKTSTDALNHSTSFEYGVNCGGSAFESSGFKPTRTVDPRGYVTTVTYDSLYRPTGKSVQYQLSPPLFSTTETEYDAVGNALATVDPLTRRTETDYDALNRPWRVRYGITSPGTSQVTETYGATLMAYTSTGLKWKVTDERGSFSASASGLYTTTTQYDTAGRTTTVSTPVSDGTATLSTTTITFYDAAGNVSATINPRGYRWDYAYDVRNRKTDELQPSVLDSVTATNSRPRTHTDYDAVGNVLAVRDARGNYGYSLYDAANRKTHTIAPSAPVTLPSGVDATLSTVLRTEYDKSGNILKTWLGGIAQPATLRAASDPYAVTLTGLIRTAQNSYDNLNHLRTSLDAENISVINEYDSVGNRTAVIDGKGQRTEFTYDGLNRLLTTKDPANVLTTLHYDALNKTGRTDSNNHETGYGYDSRNRLTTVTYSGSLAENRTYTYDIVGNLTSVTQSNALANVAYSYDALNRQTSETSGGVTHQYRYDLAGNRLTTTYGGTNRVISSTYDALNRLFTMTEGATHTTTYSYDLGGNIVRKTLPNGDAIQSLFDSLNRTAALTSTTTNGGNLYAYTYRYDLTSNVRTIVEIYSGGLNNRTVTNNYDNANRLIEEAIVAGATTTRTTYGYDNAHNRKTKSVIINAAPSVTTTYSYNTLNQLTSTTAGDAYTYDDNGNRLTHTKGGQTDTYGYDRENRLVELIKNIPGTALQTGTYRYQYDYRTRRILRDETGISGGVKTQLIYSGSTSAQEYTLASGTDLPSTTPDVEYIRGSDYGGGIGGILYTLRADALLGDKPSYTHANRRGDIIAKTDGSGSLTYQAVYEAYGKRTQESGSTQDRQKANSKDEDPTGLLNEGMRYRDLDTGTFITRDPLGFVDGPNMYAYVVDNPWTNFDPEGLTFQEAQIGAFVMVNAPNWSDKAAGAAFMLAASWDTAETITSFIPGKGKAQDLLKQGVKSALKEGAKKAAEKQVKTAVRDKVKDAVDKNRQNPGGESAKTTSESNDKKVPNPDGSKGKTDHQEAVKDLVTEKQTQYPESQGYTVDSNKSIKDETGVNRRPDATVKNSDGNVVEVGEVARTNQNGTVVSREQKKLDQYKEANIPVTVKKLPPPERK